MTGSNGLRIVR